VVIVLSAVIAVAIAIPALADSGTTAKTASVKGLTVRALAKAKAALRIGRTAKREVHKAVTAAALSQSAATAAQEATAVAKAEAAKGFEKASSARETAGGAELKAKETNEAFALTRPHVGFAEGKASTASETFVGLSGGPTVTVTVPAAGLVQVWGQALIDAGAEPNADGVVSLYEDGHQAEGQADCAGIEGVLFSGASVAGEPELVGTPAGLNFAGACSSLGAPGPVLFRTTNGEHTFELRYASCSCGGEAESVTFSQRRLVVAPLP
jgi:hypothetical protein